MAHKMFKKMRGLDDKTLGGVLTNHADTLRGIAMATTMLLRERRVMLLWMIVVTTAVMYLGVTR